MLQMPEMPTQIEEVASWKLKLTKAEVDMESQVGIIYYSTLGNHFLIIVETFVEVV